AVARPRPPGVAARGRPVSRERRGPAPRGIRALAIRTGLLGARRRRPAGAAELALVRDRVRHDDALLAAGDPRPGPRQPAHAQPPAPGRDDVLPTWRREGVRRRHLELPGGARLPLVPSLARERLAAA